MFTNYDELHELIDRRFFFVNLETIRAVSVNQAMSKLHPRMSEWSNRPNTSNELSA
jgi:hypothetical protein